MSEEFATGTETGVENPAAAEQENTEVNGTEADLEQSGTSENTGVEGENNPDDPAAGDQDNDAFDERTESAFAKRLAAERERIRAEVARDSQQALLQELDPLLEMARFEAARHGMDPITWAKEVQKSRDSNYQRMLQSRAEEFGLDPQVLSELIGNHPDVVKGKQLQQQQQMTEQQRQEQQKQAEAQQRFESEGRELFDSYPDLDPKDIPQEVYVLRSQRGISLLDAYNRVMVPKMAQANKVKEQNAANAGKSPGGIKGNPPPANDYFSREQVQKMSQAEVDKHYDVIWESMKKWK